MWSNKYVRLAIATSASVATVAALNPIEVQAEGSADLVRYEGDRPFLEWDVNGKTAGIQRKTVLYAYAKAGEKILLGSSVNNASDHDIVVTDPNGVRHTLDVDEQGNGVGYINTVNKETRGPKLNESDQDYGFIPLSLDVQTSGWYAIEFHPNKSGGGDNPTPAKYNEEFFSNQNTKTVAAWDITVVGADDAEKLGRVYANYLALNMGANQKSLNSKLYILTKDGYQYLTDMNGIDPYGFIFFSNNRGFIDSDGTTSYKSVGITSDSKSGTLKQGATV